MESPPDEIAQHRSESDLLSSMPLPALALCLLWWVFTNPAAYTRAKTFPDLQKRLYRAANWLICTLLLAVPAIPLIGFITETVPFSPGTRQAGFVPHHWLILLGLIWAIISLSIFSQKSKEMYFIGTLMVGFIAFLTAVLLEERLVMAYVLLIGAALFAAFEDDLLTNPPRRPRWHQHTKLAEFLGFALGLLIIFVLMIALAVIILRISAAFAGAALIVMQVNQAVKTQQPNVITKLMIIALPLAYIALIWVYWLGGWQIMGI